MELNRDRVAWVDYAKGFCIVMVVMMHATLGVEEAAGATSWMGALVAFAKPFRMPDFFLISGLFLARVIDRNWRDYLDTKVVHFAYFYVLWVTIQFAFKAPVFAADLGWAGVAEAYALAFIDPFGTLWFIYLLPIFFVVAKLTRDVPQVMVWFAAALLQIAGVETGWTVVDEFCSRFVYFYSGYVLAPYVFDFAATAAGNRGAALLFLAAWAVFEAVMVFGGYSEFPVVSLGLGFLGALAVVAASVLLSTRDWALPLRYAGENSIVVYLAFFLPMAATRMALLKLAPGLDLGVVALVVTAAGVVTPLIVHTLVKTTSLRFLFQRPGWAKLPPAVPRPATAAA
ncbi:MAG: acyltransferase family protein [Methyloceanibacter sp.]|uniref:acyltransferase family protein n=1 Tax=Methyloceanibacter sp. TaxID=1965321 RepID=UPI003D6DA5FF